MKNSDYWMLWHSEKENMKEREHERKRRKFFRKRESEKKEKVGNVHRFLSFPLSLVTWFPLLYHVSLSLSLSLSHTHTHKMSHTPPIFGTPLSFSLFLSLSPLSLLVLSFLSLFYFGCLHDYSNGPPHSFIWPILVLNYQMFGPLL